MHPERIRRRIFDVIQIGIRTDRLSRAFDYFITAAIFINVLSLFLETFETCRPYLGILSAAEDVTVAVFCIEYGLRIWTADLLYPGLGKKRAVLRFLVSFEGIVDLLTILPILSLSGFAALRFLRVFRIFHLFRINKQYDSFHVITSVLTEKRNQLFSSVFIIAILMLTSSLCMYQVEHPVQPEAFRSAFSGIWWSLSTVFTVGYGDIYPVTHLGRLLAILTTFLGVGAVAIPTGIISAGFVEHYTRMQEKETDLHPRGTIVHMLLEKRSPCTGKTVRIIETVYHVSVLAVIRGGAVLVPSDDLALKTGDDLILHSFGNSPI